MAQKTVTDQLKAATLIHNNLGLCKEKASCQLTLQLYYELHYILRIATSIKLLNCHNDQGQKRCAKLVA